MTSALSAHAFDQFTTNRLFDGIESNLLEKIRPEVDIREYRPGDVVFNEGDPGDSLYLVGEGSIKISKQGRVGSRKCSAIFSPVISLAKWRSWTGNRARRWQRPPKPRCSAR